MLILDKLKQNFKWIIIIFFVFIFFIGYMVTEKNYYYSLLFFTNREKTKLLAERRKIVKGKTKVEKIRNSIQELLLGPMDPELYTLFPTDSKLISVRIEKRTVHVNLNKETFLNIEERNNSSDICTLMLQSIVHTIYFQNKWVEKVKFYVEGKEYNFIGDAGPLNNGVKPNWNLVK